MNKFKDRQYPESRAIARLLICHCNYAVVRINMKIKNIIKNAAQSGGGTEKLSESIINPALF